VAKQRAWLPDELPQLLVRATELVALRSVPGQVLGQRFRLFAKAIPRAFGDLADRRQAEHS
jgi:hypothetical protein